MFVYIFVPLTYFWNIEYCFRVSFCVQQKYYSFWRPIRDPLETHRRPIGVPSEALQRPKCLIGDPSDNEIPDRRSLEDRHNWSNMSNWSSMMYVSLRWCTSVSNEVCQSPMRHVSLRWGMVVSNEASRYPMFFHVTCLIGDSSENDIPDRDPFEDWHNWSTMSNWSLMSHVSLPWGMLIFAGSPMRCVRSD